MLVLTRQVGQSLIINDNITVTIISISGNNVKVGIEAPKEIIILRDDIINKQRAKKSLQKSGLEPLSTHMPTPQI